jgi:hypothetical protein
VSLQISKDYSVRAQTQDFRKGAEGITQPIEDVITAAIQGDAAGQKKAVEDLFANLKEQEQSFVNNQTKYLQETFTNVSNVIKENYSKPVETKTTADINLNMNITGDANVKDMDLNAVQDKIVKYLTQSAEGKALLKEAVENKNAPQTAQGTKTP